ncbi:MAG TPA: capsular polysaccharide biosynthesis protein CapF [Clostridiaceae bacterium]|nr:capsular polysaccharide biosynthesis protein CapF [Clostridiaceae bacterium]
MKILVTGSKGFIGKNLIMELRNQKYETLFEYDKDTDESLLDEYTRECDFVFHLAGVNRSDDESEFMKVNYGITAKLLELLKRNNNRCPIVFTSSIQADLDNPYGKSKKACEELIFKYGEENNVKTLVYRLQNVFGKWCKPNYNSVVATFCHNIAAGLPIIISDPQKVLNLVYIDDVVSEFLRALKGEEQRKDTFCCEECHNKNTFYCEVPISYNVKLGEIADLIYSFKQSRETLAIPDMSNEFVKKLYSTYLSYLPTEQLNYPLKINADSRGIFVEIIRTVDRGQISVNISGKGVTKGNHWHNTKTEKFIVVSGRGIISLRRPDGKEIIKYYVSGDKPEVVDIPPGYTHSIQNVGDTDLVTIIWSNECFDPSKPDTYYLEV